MAKFSTKSRRDPETCYRVLPGTAGKLTFTIVETDEAVAKTYGYEDGKVVARPGHGHLRKGKIRVVTIEGSPAEMAEQFAEMVENANPRQVLIQGCPPDMESELVTEKEFKRRNGVGCVPRTLEHFKYVKGAVGLFTIDYDYTPHPTNPNAPPDTPPEVQPLTSEDIIVALTDAWPGFAKAAYVRTASTSGNLFKDGVCVKPITGQRIWFLGENMEYAEAAARVLKTRVWAKRHGGLKIGKVGQILEAGVMDFSVITSNHIEYAFGGAELTDELEQRREAVASSRNRLLDLKALALSSDTTLEGQAEANRSAMEKELKELAKPILKAHLSRLPRGQRGRARDAIKYRTLYGTDTLRIAFDYPDRGLVEGQIVTVDEIRADRERFHKVAVADPVDGTNRSDGDTRIAILLTLQHDPVCYSHAHGGVTYKLVSESKKVVRDLDDQLEAINAEWAKVSDGNGVSYARLHLNQTKGIMEVKRLKQSALIEDTLADWRSLQKDKKEGMLIPAES